MSVDSGQASSEGNGLDVIEFLPITSLVTLRNGKKLPLIGFGTYKITGDQVYPALEAALKVGYRLFDTAQVYNNEKEIGDALEILLPKFKLERKDIYLITKVYIPDEKPFEGTCKLIEKSLKRLKTNYIDSVLLHYPRPAKFDDKDPRNERFRSKAYFALDKYRTSGKILSPGVSNFEIPHLEQLKSLGHRPFINQVELHPHLTREQLKDYCEDHKIFLQAFSSLARHSEVLYRSPRITKIAEKYNIEKPTVLLSWAASQSVGVIPKSTNPERMEKNSTLLKLTKEEIKSLDALDIGRHYVTRTTGWLVS